MSGINGKIELWFFRDLVDEQRLKLFRLLGIPTDGLSTLSAQKIAINSILSSGNAKNERLLEALKPFADAAGCMDGDERDGADIWEHPCAVAIEFRHLRAAHDALTKQEG